MSLPTFKAWATSFWDYAIRGIIYEKYPPAPRKITAEWIKMAIRECAEIFTRALIEVLRSKSKRSS